MRPCQIAPTSKRQTAILCQRRALYARRCRLRACRPSLCARLTLWYSFLGNVHAQLRPKRLMLRPKCIACNNESMHAYFHQRTIARTYPPYARAHAHEHVLFTNRHESKDERTPTQMDSPEELLVPITHVQVLAGLQGRGTNHTTCQLLGCGCSMCKLSTWPLDHLNYSSFEGGERGASSGDAQSSLALTFDKLLPYKRISYVTQGSTVKIHCNLGHRIDSHDPGAPRSQAVACNFSHRNEFGFESLTQSSSNEGWNCGFLWPLPCKPVTCGAYAPLSSRVVSRAWSRDRLFYYDPSAQPLSVECADGFFVSSSDAVQCVQQFNVTCGPEGEWLGNQVCVPLSCSLANLIATGSGSIPDENTEIVLPRDLDVFEGGPYVASAASHVSVPFGRSVYLQCAQDYQRSEDGSIAPACGQKCQFNSSVISCALFAGTCSPWDTFELGPGVNLSNPYLMTLHPLKTFETQSIECKEGFILDNTNGPVALAGLLSLGELEVKSSAIYPSPSTTNATAISLPLPGASIEILPGVWPEGAGPLSVVVFDLRGDGIQTREVEDTYVASTRHSTPSGLSNTAERRSKSLKTILNSSAGAKRHQHRKETDFDAMPSPVHRRGARGKDGGVVVSDCLDFGPDGLKLNAPVTIKIPFDYRSAAPYRNALFELQAR